ncbi:MAG: penicillin-binding transpeptidase domain-containing protein [Oscillospiraceae bacterium]
MTDRTFRCTGSVDIDGDTITCPYVHGTMDFHEAMANSCNCVFAQLAVELGGETMEQYARAAGLLEGHTVSGIATAAGAYAVSNANSEVGWSGVGQYEDLVNPCALMTMMGAIAGRGSAREPYLLEKVTSWAPVSPMPPAPPEKCSSGPGIPATLWRKCCATM